MSRNPSSKEPSPNGRADPIGPAAPAPADPIGPAAPAPADPISAAAPAPADPPGGADPTPADPSSAGDRWQGSPSRPDHPSRGPSTVSRWRRALEAALGPADLEENVPLAPFTTFRIGGPADLLYHARSAESMVTVVNLAKELRIPTFLLGRGANILVGDRGFRGLVIRCEIGGIQFPEPGSDSPPGSDARVEAGAGVLVYPDLIHATVRRDLGGLHHFAGIPSTVGGAIWQNLHFLSPAPGRERTVFVEEFVQSAQILSEAGDLVVVDGEYFDFGYDYSVLHDQEDVVLTVTFRLRPEPREVLETVMRENLAWRRERHPDLSTHPSAGSVFKKVAGIGAGRLIDECGLKGRIVGGAQISELHANIIVNLGGATATDVLTLMQMAKSAVQRETGHTLEAEITLVGEF